MTTLFIVFALLLLLNTFFVLKRTIEVNKLHALYDSLENEVIKHKLHPDKKLITFLKIIKTPIYLNHNLDIFRIVKSLDAIERDKNFKKRKESFLRYKESLPEEVKTILDKINKKQDIIITLSIAKPLNLVYVACILVLSIIGFIIYGICKAFGFIYDSLIKTPRQVMESYNSESLIISYKQTRVYC